MPSKRLLTIIGIVVLGAALVAACQARGPAPATAIVGSASVSADQATATATLAPATSTLQPTTSLTPSFTATSLPTPTATPSPTPWLLGGVTRDAETGKPLADVELTWGDSVVQSAASGGYAFAQEGDDQIPVCASLPGYDEACLQPEYGQTLDFPLKPHVVEFVIFDPTSYEPLGGVSISGEGVGGQTDAEGYLALSRLQPGMTLSVERSGYLPAEVSYQGQSRITWPLRPRIFQGVVWDGQASQAIGGAKIVWRDDEGKQQMASSDADGAYQLSGITPPGSLSILAPGYLSYTLPITMNISAVLTATLEPFEVRAVYVPFGLLYLADRVQQIVDLVGRTELNAIVVDVKSDRGLIAHHSQQEIAIEGEAFTPNMIDLGELVKQCREKGIYTIARLVLFKDPVLTTVRPDYAIKREDGSLYTDLEGLNWADPFREEVRAYNIALAKEVAALGFDEIQFDYLRFPSDGTTRDLVYGVENNARTRSACIGGFMEEAYAALKPVGVMVSADIFGLAVWMNGDRDLGIGQLLDEIAPHVDYISPMLYPSTFIKGNLGLDNPSAYPYDVVYRSCMNTLERTNTKLRPWLQSYWGDTAYYLNEKKAANDADTYGWMFWNAGGKYEAGLFEADKATSPSSPSP